MGRAYMAGKKKQQTELDLDNVELTEDEMEQVKDHVAAVMAEEAAVGQMMERAAYAAGQQMDVEARTLYLMEEISDDLLRRFLPQLHALDSTPGPIRIVLCTGGGSVVAGVAIYNAIRAAKNPVIVEGTGMVFSMGATILQAGDVRYLHEGTRFMIHSGSVGGGDQELLAHLANADEARELRKWNNRTLAKHSGLALAEVEAMTSAETFLSATEAVKKGFADKVLRPKKKKVTA